MEELYDIAERLHKKFCKSSHEDECSWYNRRIDWNEYPYSNWFWKAKEVKKMMTNYNLSYNDIVEIMDYKISSKW